MKANVKRCPCAIGGPEASKQPSQIKGLPLFCALPFPRTGASLERSLCEDFLDIFKWEQERSKGCPVLVVLYCIFCSVELCLPCNGY